MKIRLILLFFLALSTPLHAGFISQPGISGIALDAEVQSGSLLYCLDSGTTDAYACSLTPALTAYTEGQFVLLKVATDNTGDATLNIDSLGAKSILRSDGDTLSDGDINLLRFYLLVYDGAAFRIQAESGAGATPTWPQVLAAGNEVAAACSDTDKPTIVDPLSSSNKAEDCWDATLGFVRRIIVGGVLWDRDIIWKLIANRFAAVYDRNNNPVFKVLESGAINNATLDAEATGNNITLPIESWFDAAACQNTTASHVWDTPTTNSPAATCDTGTNTQKGYLAFDDTTDEAIQFKFRLPTGFTGNIDFILRWKAAATTGAVGWCVQLVRVPVGATSDPAFPAQAAGNCVSTTAQGTTLQENESTISAATCTSCVAGDLVYGRLSRDADGGAVTDSMTGDGLLLGWTRRIRVTH